MADDTDSLIKYLIYRHFRFLRQVSELIWREKKKIRATNNDSKINPKVCLNKFNRSVDPIESGVNEYPVFFYSGRF